MELDTRQPATSPAPVAGFQTLDRARCLELLRSARYGRMATATGITPMVAPVRLTPGPGYIGFELSPAGPPLAGKGMAALEVDRIDPTGSWSVVVTGPVAAHDGYLGIDLAEASISGRAVTPANPGFAGDVPSVIPPAGVIPPDQAIRLLRHQPVGYLAVVAGHTPHIFPVNYALDGDSVIFRTNTGTKLHALSRSLVAFQVDHLNPDGTGWAVLIEGIADELTSASPDAVKARVATLAVEPWAPGYRPYFVRITPLRVHGLSHRWA